MSEIKKSSYAITPSFVLLDDSLDFGAKNLYGIISMYSEEGRCWASNAYFAKLHKVTIRCIQLWLAQLSEAGYITKIKYEEIDIVKFLKLKKPIKFDCPIHFPVETCEWCESETYCLSKHHYPTRKEHGGKDVVNICANCHQEFHFLCDHPKYSITKAGK